MSVLSVKLPAEAKRAGGPSGSMGSNGVATTGLDRVLGSWGGPSGSNGVSLNGLAR